MTAIQLTSSIIIYCYKQSQPSGELLLSLTYDTITSTLTLATLKARNIFDNEVEQSINHCIVFQVIYSCFP